MQSLAIVRTYFRLGLINFVQYRADFFIAVVNAFIQIASQVLAIAVIFNQTDSLKGWSRDDLIVLAGVQLVVGGVLGIVIRPSMQAFMESIRLGTFDFLLTKPADSQLLASVQSVAPQAITQLLIGIGVIVTGLMLQGTSVAIVSLLLFSVLLLAGIAMVYSFMMVLATFTFWFVKLDNILVIFNTMFGNAGSWPITIYPGWLRVSLTFIIPIAFAVTVPSEALLGRVSWQNVLLTFALATLFVLVARKFWTYAIRHYTGASA